MTETPITPDETEALERLLEGATPGKWVAWGEDQRGLPRISYKPGTGHTFEIASVTSWDRAEANRALIVAAVNALPRLLAAVRDRERVEAALRPIFEHGYQPMYNGRPSCPFCGNFVDEEETHTEMCFLQAALTRNGADHA